MAHNQAQASNPRGVGFLNDLKALAQRFPEVPLGAYQNGLPNQISYSFQRGLELYGQAYDLNNTLLSNEKIQILIKDKKDVEVREVETNTDGLFTLTGLQFEGKVTMTFRREGNNPKEQLVKVIPYQYELPKLKMDKRSVVEASGQVQKSRQMIPQKRLSDFDFEDKPSDLIPLEEVILVGQRVLGKTSTSVYGIEPDRMVHQNPERPKPLPQLFSWYSRNLRLRYRGFKPILKYTFNGGFGATVVGNRWLSLTQKFLYRPLDNRWNSHASTHPFTGGDGYCSLCCCGTY